MNNLFYCHWTYLIAANYSQKLKFYDSFYKNNIFLALFCLFRHVNLSVKKSFSKYWINVTNFFFSKTVSYNYKSKFNGILIFITEKASSKTGMVAGSVGGALVLVTIILILGIVLHRRYTCICKIGNHSLTLQGFYEQFYFANNSLKTWIRFGNSTNSSKRPILHRLLNKTHLELQSSLHIVFDSVNVQIIEF